MSKKQTVTLIVAAILFVLAVLVTIFTIRSIQTIPLGVVLIGVIDCFITAFLGGVIGYVIRDKYIGTKSNSK